MVHWKRSMLKAIYALWSTADSPVRLLKIAKSPLLSEISKQLGCWRKNIAGVKKECWHRWVQPGTRPEKIP
jgi:hypothetical protein